MEYALYFIIIAAFGCAAWAFLPKKEADTVSIISRRRQAIKPSKAALKLLVPISAINESILQSIPFMKRKLDKKLSFIRWQISPAEFLSVKELIAVAAGSFVFFLFPQALIWVTVAALFGFLIPDMILSSKTKARKEEIVRIMPETVDLLSLCVSAGLDFMASVRWITAKARTNPMIEELRVILEETKIGRPKIEAMREMARRLDIPEMNSFVRSLIQAEKMGTPVEETFKIISDDVRTRRSFRGKKEAQKTAMKMLIPLIVFILPIILIIVAGPVLLQFMQGGFGEMMK